VPLVRCPRCLAEDISADAHPSRRLVDGRAEPYLVCGNCFRPAELEFRIACNTDGPDYSPLPTRESLRLLRDLYLTREHDSPDPRVAEALEDVERRLAIGPLDS
jgi:hypothetical protein